MSQASSVVDNSDFLKLGSRLHTSCHSIVEIDHLSPAACGYIRLVNRELHLLLLRWLWTFHRELRWMSYRQVAHLRYYRVGPISSMFPSRESPRTLSLRHWPLSLYFDHLDCNMQISYPEVAMCQTFTFEVSMCPVSLLNHARMIISPRLTLRSGIRLCAEAKAVLIFLCQ